MSYRVLTKRNLALFTFIVSLAATFGSLYYSEIVLLLPCKLCWYQRILMYPIVLLSLTALFRKSKELPHYVLPLSVIGMVISAYHITLQRMAPLSELITTPCRPGVICTRTAIEYVGFITIPLMAFAAFAFISIALWLSLRVDR